MLMFVEDLNREQLNELKETYATQLKETADDVFGISYEELANAKMIPDEVIFEHYDGIIFTDDDFFCSANL